MSTVSVIIPVYNVEKYLARCVDSIRSQTYHQLEILLVDDGSPDNCPVMCDEYARQDSRIRVIHQSNAGLGAARNRGLAEATGEYVLYVDSDDWIAEDCVEVFVNNAISRKVDFVANSSFYQVEGNEITVVRSLPQGMYITKDDRDIILMGGLVNMWTKFFRRTWLIEKGLFQPNIYTYEDWGAYPCMIGSAERIYVLDYPCYYYTFARKGCITTGSETRLIQDFQSTIIFMLSFMKKNCIWSIMQSTLKYYCLRDYYVRVCLNQKSQNTDALQILAKIRNDILEKEFGNFDIVEKKKYLVLGSFSLRWEVQKCSLAGGKLDDHFCFSSIVSVFSSPLDYEAAHVNDFRKRQIEQELKSELVQKLMDSDKDTIFVLDFIEERYNLLEIIPGIYMTKSEAFCESNLKDIEYIREISNESIEYMEFWQSACDELAVLLEKYMDPTQIVLVKNRMSLTYGDFEKAVSYDEKVELQRINRRVEDMENYFCRRLPGIIQVENDMDYCFTDSNFSYGCRPEYANNAWYTKIGFELFKTIVG